MRIAIIGYGQMGKMVELAAKKKGYEVVCCIDPKCEIKSVHADAISLADVCIDFSKPDCLLDNVRNAAECGKNIVVGTTGWHEHLDEVKAVVLKSKIGFLHSPNFSLGINLFLKIVAEAARLMRFHDEYDVGGIECHHKLKVDAPSGTAKAIAHTLVQNLKRPDLKELTFTSLRCGTIPGTHQVIFDSPSDMITLTHEARDRKSFAEGALIAAEWLAGKTGFYTIDDLWK